MLSGEALAQPAGSNVTTEEDEALEQEAGTKRPAGPDDRTGHVLVHGSFGFSQPFGSIAAKVPATRVSGGAAFGAHLGVGLSRVTVLEASGSYARLHATADCRDCSGTSFDLGLGFVYHIAQGIAFDPWISYGVGYRIATFAGATGLASGPQIFPDSAFRGLDIARVALGGDFYPIPTVGLGAFLEIDAGTYLSRPDERLAATAYGFFQVGVRLSLDPLPRGRRAPAAAAGAPPRGVTGAAARDTAARGGSRNLGGP
jgi:hypothetical protein